MKEKKFWDDLRPDPKGKAFFDCLWRSPLQALCFLMYSRLACEATWRGHANFPKLIQIKVTGLHWKWSTLCFVEPYSSTVNEENCLFKGQFNYFSIYNTISTVCNCLCIIILLNKYQDDTSFVFFIIACMICVYVDSNVVAVHYFALNSHDKLTDARVTVQSCLVISLYLRVKKKSK